MASTLRNQLNLNFSSSFALRGRSGLDLFLTRNGTFSDEDCTLQRVGAEAGHIDCLPFCGMHEAMALLDRKQSNPLRDEFASDVVGHRYELHDDKT